MWKCSPHGSPGHKHTLRAVLLADRAHAIADLAWHFAPNVDISHVLVAAVSHVHAYSDLYEYVRITPPALLVWLVREFDLAGEAFSSPMTCFDTTPSPQHSHFAQMPVSLRGVSIHPQHQTRNPVPFADQFADPTPFPHSVLVSLDFPSVTSVAAACFFPQVLRNHGGRAYGSPSRWIPRPPLEPAHPPDPSADCTRRRAGCHSLHHVP